MFQFFEYVGAFFDSILTIIKNIFNGLIMLVQLLSSVPVFFLTLYFLPAPLLSAVMLTVNVALFYMIIGRNAGG